MFGVLVIAVVALILGAVALNKANMTGNAFWTDWFSNQEAKAQNNVQENVGVASEGNGLLGDAYISKGGDSNNLKSYKVEYDKEGNMIYELVNGRVSPGENYVFQEHESGELTIVAASASNPALEPLGGNSIVATCQHCEAVPSVGGCTQSSCDWGICEMLILVTGNWVEIDCLGDCFCDECTVGCSPYAFTPTPL